MKTMKKILGYAFIVALLGIAAGCDEFTEGSREFDNVVYFDVSQTDAVQQVSFSNRLAEIDYPIHATLTYPASADVSVTAEVAEGLVAEYNRRHGTQWPLLDSRYFELQNSQVTIPAGSVISSQPVTLHLKGLTGAGEGQTDALPIDATYLVPVRIASSSVSAMNGADVAYYVVKRSSNITVAVQLTDVGIGFPKLNEDNEASRAWNGLTAVTYEALIYIDKFDTTNGFGACNISTVMGVEGYLLLRIGDTSFEREQLQFDGSGGGSAFGKFPARDAAKKLQAGRWYHVACTYDQTTRTVRVYVDGQIQSESTGVGVETPGTDNRINLAMRALSGKTDDRPFAVSYSYNAWRALQGKMAEIRVWSEARTPEQIRENMYGVVDPENEPTLLGYWKCDEGEGDVIRDYSKYGIDGYPSWDDRRSLEHPSTLEKKHFAWPSGIEIPKINQTEE